MDKTTIPSQDSLFDKHGFSWFVIIAALYIIRSIAWMNSELWYDEVLTLTRFIVNPVNPSFGYVFRDYPIANNHMLSTAVYWLWVRLIGFPGEALLRLPSILFGLGTIALILRHWRRWIGDCLATLGGFLFAVSPVFTAYAYQVRGYSLTFFLTAAAISGLLEITDGRHALRGHIIMSAACLLLPLVMPTNAMVVPSLAAMIFIAELSERHGWKLAVTRALPSAIATCFGLSYYLTIWPQFQKAMAEPDGWDSAWKVALNLLLGFLAHTPLIAIAVFSPKNTDDNNTTASQNHRSSMLRQAVVAFAVAGVTIVGILCLSTVKHAPFPRVFLVFLPVLSFATLRLLQARECCRRWTFATLAVLILCNGILWERLATSITLSQLECGYVPDNLLQQYYRGSTELRSIANSIKQQDDSLFIVTDAYDIRSFRFYWSLSGHPIDSVSGDNELPETFSQLPALHGKKVLVLSRTAAQAAAIFQKGGYGKAEELLPLLQDKTPVKTSLRRLYCLPPKP